MSITHATAISEELPVELRELLNSAEGPAFEHALDVMVRQREQHMFRALGQLARDLHDAVRRLGADLAHEGFPGSVADARQYLQEALEMSDKAAHRTIDFADRISPQAASLMSSAGAVLERAPDAASGALARESAAFAVTCRDGLTEMVVAQSWQDLTGQRIKKVDGFIGSVESTLLELVRLTGALAGSEMPARVAKVSSQEEADRLLSEFGF